MNYTNVAKKRALILCVFFMFSCTNEQADNQHSSSDDPASPATQSENIVPLLSLQELMNASDVKLALSEAAKQQDKDAFLYWQEELLKAADEVNLLASERKLIEGQQGLAFIEFQGIKTNYQQEFEQAFLEFGDVDAIYLKYPAFENAHAQSKELLIKRDALINTVAQELKQQGFEGDALQEARAQWQNYASQNMRETLQKDLEQ